MPADVIDNRVDDVVMAGSSMRVNAIRVPAAIRSLHRADLVSADASGSTLKCCRSDGSLFCLSCIETNAALMIASPASGTRPVAPDCDEPDTLANQWPERPAARL